MFYCGSKKQVDKLGDLADDLDMKIWKLNNEKTSGDSKEELAKLEKKRDRIDKAIARGFGIV